MGRVQVINRVLRALGGGLYLEIGVKGGDTFVRIKADRKIGVDPIRPRWQVVRYGLRHWQAKYYRLTSDVFFERHGTVLEEGIAVALVDGLHEYHQSYRDVVNCLQYLREDGVIVMHDCNPQSGEAAIGLYDPEAPADLGRRPGAWNGDVWKTAVRLRSERRDLQVCVLDMDQGLGLIRRGPAEEALPFTPEEIEAMTYADLELDRQRLLNLRPAEYLDAFVAGLGRREDHDSERAPA